MQPNRAARRRQLRPDREARTPGKTYIAKGGEQGEPNVLGRVPLPPATMRPLAELRRGRKARTAAELALLRHRLPPKSRIVVPDIVA